MSKLFERETMITEKKENGHEEGSAGRIAVQCRGCEHMRDDAGKHVTEGRSIGVCAFPGRCARCGGRLQELYVRASREYYCEACEHGDSYNHNN